MKVLIATGLYPPESGGPATYTKLLEERLPGQGFVVPILPFSRVRHLPKFLRHIAYFFTCLRMARRADVIYALDTVSVGFPAAIAALVSGKKFLVRVPGDYAWEQGVQHFDVQDSLDAFQSKKYGAQVETLRSVQKFVVRSARAVVVPSDYMKRIVSGWGAKNIEVIYSSIDLGVTPELPATRPEGFLVVTSGRRVPWKGFEGIERAVEREKGWRFFVAEGLPRAQALGWVKTANVFALNSSYEGLSHALIEAMALGTPIVATRVGGNPELIEDGVDGILVPPHDDAALHAAIKKIADDPEAAKARAESARAKTGQFSIDTTITQLVALLKTV
ncbi:MAG: group 1 glycosyl transferase [Parcubacteria group bacterium Gr01-1014_56]|nr:MAG: group 1 glycosyl transferase [Parcubacteria group bacterium Gr01-1014_56]